MAFFLHALKEMHRFLAVHTQQMPEPEFAATSAAAAASAEAQTSTTEATSG